MDLRKRLQQIVPAESSQRRPDEGETPAKTNLEGEEKRNELGTFWLRTIDHPLQELHGCHRLSALLDLVPERMALAAHDQALHGFSPTRAVFLDTETTSLSGGAGVYVFMAGIGFIHGNSFRVEQYFMRDYDEEPAMLRGLNQRLSSFSALVSFFGKNFDRYRLEDRMTLQGVTSSLPTDRHLDLYHVGRRLFKDRFPNLKLQTLEKQVLKFHRRGDIPGAECPEAYFSYIEGDARTRIQEVFEHNFWDILSLASLAVEVDRMLASPRDGWERYTLARAHTALGDPCAALPLLEAALLDPPDAPWVFDAYTRLVTLLKREKHARLKPTVECFANRYPRNPEALIEMAKYLEHRDKDPGKALPFAEEALRLMRHWQGNAARTKKRVEEGIHRVDRLKTKVRAL